MTSVWDDPSFKINSDYIKFEAPGDGVSGTIQAVRVRRWDDGSASPELLITTDEGEEKTLTVGQVRLKAALAEQRPEAGDHIKVFLTDIEKRQGGKSLKHFDVTVSRQNGGGNTATVTSQEQMPVGGDVPPDLVAALKNIDPAVLKGLGIGGSNNPT